MSRVRSPNYPAMSLPDAIDRVRTIHKAEGKNSMARESIVTILGFSGINGASATVVSAIGKYGLLESVGHGESRVSDLAVRILYPESAEDKQEALAEAAGRPVLFREIKEKWPERPPSDENLRSFLVRKGFGQNALDSVIRFYRETIDIVGSGRNGYSEAQSIEERTMSHGAEAGSASYRAPPSQRPSAPPFAEAALHDTLDAATTSADTPFSQRCQVYVAPGVIKASATFYTAAEVDRMIRVLQANKALLDEEGEPV